MTEEHGDAYEGPDDAVPAIVQEKPASTKRTPTEAKADAVGNLLAAAVARASELRLTPEETKALKADFPDESFRKGAAGKENLIYIEHIHLRNRMDEVLGMGQWSIVQLSRWNEAFDYADRHGQKHEGIKVFVEGALIVRGCYCGQSIGDMDYYPTNASVNLGDAVEGAKSAVLRRCAKEFGIGLQAWSKTWCEGWWARQGTKTPTNQHTPGADDQPNRNELPVCPKCGKNDSVIVGKIEYGGGYVCWRKKPDTPGCGHSWGGKDVRNGQDAAPAKEYPDILDSLKKLLDPEKPMSHFNTVVLDFYKAIPGKHPQRAKAWKVIMDFVTENGTAWNKGEGKFYPAPVTV